MKMCENALHFLFKYLENVFDEKEEKDLILMLARKVDNMDEKEKNNLKQILFK